MLTTYTMKLGCLIIDVHDKSIEETATVIMESLDLDSYQ
ncbi:hypothetical protein AKUH4B406M_08900 [Apilactobacillus kunkeei]|nr:hypothetical protein AKUH4B406M_08900 [Apilactobacillus kunkeei]